MTWNDTIINKSVKALALSVNSILGAQDCDKARAMATTFMQFRDYLQRNVVKLAPPRDPADDDEAGENEEEQDDDETGTLPPLVEQTIAALREANPLLSRQVAADFLLHNRHGRQLLEDLSKQQKGHQPMDRATELRKMAGEYGVARIAKMIVMENDAHGLSEHELTKMADDEAQKTRQSGERPASAFARFYEAPENLELRKAFQIAKNTPAPLMSIEPVQVGGQDALDVNDAKKAYDQLTALAEEQRRRSPELSSAQAFARVFEDPQYADLANAAHRRPTPTTSYPMPR